MKDWIGRILAMLAGIFAIFALGKRSAKNEIVAETEQQARELEADAEAVNQQGAETEEKIRDEIRNNPVRDIDLD